MKKLFSFSISYSQKYNRTAIYFLAQAYLHYIKFSMHPLDYFFYDLIKNNSFDPKEHANTLFTYRFQNKLNNKKFTKYFSNKILFNQKFKNFTKHDFLDLRSVTPEELEEWIMNKKTNYFMVKKAKGLGGFGVKKIRLELENNKIIINNQPFKNYFSTIRKFDLIEEFVVQHNAIMKLNPSCLNTVRVLSVLNKEGKAEIIGAVFRVGVNNDVDNFHSGGIAVNIDLVSGQLTGKGFRLNPENEKYFPFHPVTKMKFDGYQLPYWDELLETITKAAIVFPQVRTVGWDVAITPKGISLIEGNHNWDKRIIEIALKKGIRKDLEKYI